MASISAQELLTVWERGRGLHPVDRALVLLAAAEPGTPGEALASLAVGERDARLLAVREQLFGPELDCLVDCVHCGERLEFSLSTADLRAQPDAVTPATELELAYNGQRLRFRRLDSYDLATIAGCADPAEARRLLARRCLLEPGGVDLTAELIDLIAERLARCDPHAEILLTLVCPACGQDQQRLFDIATFVWAELVAQAQRLLREVDVLARRYGWREADILALSPARRQAYLELVS